MWVAVLLLRISALWISDLTPTDTTGRTTRFQSGLVRRSPSAIRSREITVTSAVQNAGYLLQGRVLADNHSTGPPMVTNRFQYSEPPYTLGLWGPSSHEPKVSFMQPIHAWPSRSLPSSPSELTAGAYTFAPFAFNSFTMTTNRSRSFFSSRLWARPFRKSINCPVMPKSVVQGLRSSILPPEALT